MKSLSAIFAILILTVCVWAQVDDKPAPITETKNATVGSDKKNGGKVSVPFEKTRPVNIPKISAPPTIDGKVDEEIWKQAAVFKDFYQTNPGDNTLPSKPTEAYIMYDEKNLYVAFKCWDEKDKIRATIAKRDNVFGEDNVRLWLDTYNDQRRAYVLGFNPLGIQQDGIFTEGRGPDFSVDIVMDSKGIIEEWGWSVEVKIPFKSLRYTAGKGKLWGFNAARNIDRLNDEFDSWMPDDRNVSGQLIKYGKISGLDEIKYERTLEIVPSVTISETGQRKTTISAAGYNAFGAYDPIFNPIGTRDPGKFVNDPIRKDIGLNLKYTLSPNVTLDAAINPDYAEIEADAPVVSANQRFPIFFQEKRPFFLEGKDIFDAPLQSFYSRTIVDPDLAVKLTGKVGKNTFGFLAASDNAPGNFSQDERGALLDCQRGRAATGDNRRCANEDLVDKNALFGVLRLKHDIGKENNVGFFATARLFPRNRNYTGGFDGRFKLNPQTVLSFQVLGTHSRKRFYSSEFDRVNYRTGNGLGYSFSLDHTAELQGWTFEAEGRSRDYRADSGFTRRTNTNTLFFANRLSTKSNAKAKLIRASWNQFGRYVFDWNGRSQEGLVGSNLNMNFQGQLSVRGEAGVGFEKLYEEEFGPKRNPATGQRGGFFGAATRSAVQPFANIFLNKTFSKQLSAFGSVGLGLNNYDFDFGAGARFPRASPAFTAYLSSQDYLNYISALYLYQANPNINPYPNFFPAPPALDPGKGRQFDANFGFEYKPTDPLRFSLNYTKSKLTRNDTKRTAFDTNIVTLRSTYQFTRFTFVRARWDYDSLSANASGQFLFGWNPNPGTAFYAGYNDNFNYKGFSPFTGQAEPGFERNSRTFFIRASYLFRKSL